MDAALEVDRLARETPEAWILNRFIVPASQLERVPAGFAPPLSVVLDTDELPDLTGRRVELVEARLERAAAVENAAGARVPRGVAGRRGPAACGRGRRARARRSAAAAPTPDMFPSPAQLAAFITGCRELGLAFKATAGLHHPVRDGIMHGFLNLLAAAVLAHAERAGEAELIAVLREEDPAAFRLTEETFAVHDREMDATTIAAARRELFVGYGSCSFSEPVEDLHALGLL